MAITDLVVALSAAGDATRGAIGQRNTTGTFAGCRHRAARRDRFAAAGVWLRARIARGDPRMGWADVLTVAKSAALMPPAVSRSAAGCGRSGSEFSQPDRGRGGVQPYCDSALNEFRRTRYAQECARFASRAQESRLQHRRRRADRREHSHRARSPTASTAARRPRGRSPRSPRRLARGRASAAAAA